MKKIIYLDSNKKVGECGKEFRELNREIEKLLNDYWNNGFIWGLIFMFSIILLLLNLGFLFIILF